MPTTDTNSLPTLSGTNEASTPSIAPTEEGLAENRTAIEAATARRAAQGPSAPTPDVSLSPADAAAAGQGIQEPIAFRPGEAAPAPAAEPAPTAPTLVPTSGTTTPSAQPQPGAVQAEVDAISAQAAADIEESRALQESSLNAETEYKDVMTELADQKYQTEQSNLDRMEELQAEMLKLRNEGIEAVAEVQRKDAEQAYQANLREMEAQRERTKRAYQAQIVEQALSNTKRTLEMENYIAATGGFGSLIKNKEMMELTLQNDRVLNTVKFEKDMADREVSNEIVTITDEYQNDLFNIETNKQLAMNEAYGEYLQYVTGIQEDRELSEDEKFETIMTAQAEYKKNIAGINQGSFEQRYEMSQRSAEQIRELKFRQVNADTSMIMGFVADANGNAILDEFGNKVEIPESMLTATQFEFIEPQYDEYGNMTSPGGSFNASTGEIVPDSSFGVPSYTRGAGGYNYSSPEYKEQVGDIFNVGGSGGWCGVYASTISTATKVGDSWAEKASHIEFRDNPTSGDKLLIPAGVTSGNSYGHVAVVLSYDAATGDIQVVESNANGAIRSDGSNTQDGKITLGTYNINDLRAKYGENFGFAGGELKPPYDDLYGGVSAYSPYNTGGRSNANLEMEADQLGLTGDSKAKFMQARLAGQSVDQAITTATSGEGGDAGGEKAGSLRTQIRQDPDIANFVQVRDGYERVQTGADLNNAQGDLSLLFGYMRMLDPTSAVRETEFANAEEAMGYANKILQIPKKFMEGDRLSEEARQDFADAAEALYAAKEANYQNAYDFYENIAVESGIDPAMVLRDYTTDITQTDEQTEEATAANTFSQADLDAYVEEQNVGKLGSNKVTEEQARAFLEGEGYSFTG